MGIEQPQERGMARDALLPSDNLGSAVASRSTAPLVPRAVAGAASRSPLAGHGMSPKRWRARAG